MNKQNIRADAPEVLYSFQCLYQSGTISTEEKNELILLFRDFLGGNKVSGNKLEASLRDIFHRTNTTMFAKQQIEKILCLIS